MKTYNKRITKTNKINFLGIALSFFVAIILTLIFPKKISFYSPFWVVLFIIYWHIKLDIKSNYNNLYYLFFLGLLCDLIFANKIGISSISFLVLGYLLSWLKPKVYFYTLFQLVLVIVLLLTTYQLVFWFYYILVGMSLNMTKVKFIAPIVTSLFVWFPLSMISDRIFFSSK